MIEDSLHDPADILVPVNKGADRGGVVFVAVGQGGGHDPAGLGVHAEMELPPRPAPFRAVLLDPLARAVELQPCAVDQQVHGAGIAASADIASARITMDYDVIRCDHS